MKDSDSYATDKWIMDLFNGWFDPCTYSDGTFRTVDGLGSSWNSSKVFVNPPYSNPLPWVEQGIREAKKGKTIVFLLKHDSSTRYYRLLHEAGAHFLMISGRLQHNTGKPANFASVLVVLNGKEGLK